MMFTWLMHDVHIDDLDLNLLRALDALLAERNVSRAAARLRLTQSATSHALARLRAVFDDPLLVRGPGGMQPTARGAALAGPIRDALDRLAAALRAPEAFDPASAQLRFTIAADDYLERILLPALLDRVWRVAPDTKLRVVPCGQRPADALSLDVDLALTVTGAIPPLNSLRMQRLFNESFVCVMRSGHPKADALDLEGYLGLPHILVAPSGRRGGVVDTALARLGRKRRVSLVLPHFLAAAAIVAGTDLVLTTGKRLARAMGAGVSILPPPLALPEFEVAMFWHERHLPDPAHRWLRMLVADVARLI